MTPITSTRLTGVVTAYDDHGGFGEVQVDQDRTAPQSAEPGARYWFHCTRLVDGSRHAEAGQPVSFRVVPGHCGRWEAADVG